MRKTRLMEGDQPVERIGAISFAILLRMNHTGGWFHQLQKAPSTVFKLPCKPFSVMIVQFSTFGLVVDRYSRKRMKTKPMQQQKLPRYVYVVSSLARQLGCRIFRREVRSAFHKLPAEISKTKNQFKIAIYSDFFQCESGSGPAIDNGFNSNCVRDPSKLSGMLYLCFRRNHQWRVKVAWRKFKERRSEDYSFRHVWAYY